MSIIDRLRGKVWCKNWGHVWDGCVCQRCKEKRGQKHDWHEGICKRCGMRRDSDETFGIDVLNEDIRNAVIKNAEILRTHFSENAVLETKRTFIWRSTPTAEMRGEVYVDTDSSCVTNELFIGESSLSEVALVAHSVGDDPDKNWDSGQRTDVTYEFLGRRLNVEKLEAFIRGLRPEDAEQVIQKTVSQSATEIK